MAEQQQSRRPDVIIGTLGLSVMAPENGATNAVHSGGLKSPALRNVAQELLGCGQLDLVVITLLKSCEISASLTSIYDFRKDS